MKLEEVSIKRFRSIESCELKNCGDFNVLIGKNNSGKSSILSAIYTFFNCINPSTVVILSPPIGKEIDFFQKDTDLPIEISINFSISLAERDALIQDIASDVPQVRNTIEGISPLLKLCVTICISPPPKHFCFVRRISLDDNGTNKNILTISNDAALELYNQLTHSKQLSTTSESILGLIERIDSDDWRRISDPEARRSLYFSSRLKDLTRIVPKFESIVRQASSYEEFREQIETIAKGMQEEVEENQKQPLTHRIDTFSGEETSIPQYVKKLLTRISKIKILQLTERRKEIGKEEAEKIRRLKVRRGNEENLRNIKNTVAALLGVEIDAYESESPSQKGEQIAELDVDKFLVEVNGSGIREALRLILDFEFGNPNILLAEEPEIHLHPALETSMMRYLKHISASCQVFLTTHSTNFLDTTEMKNVYLISKTNSTKIQHLSLGEAEAQIPRELGIRLSSLFMFDRLVFVEGATDEDIFREWAATLKVNLSQSNVGFIAMGGVRNFTHFASEKTLSFLTKRQVDIWFLMDRDERDDEEIAKLQETLGQKARVRILGKREIENYLICPRALLEFIRRKKEIVRDVNSMELTEAHLVNVIDKCAEQLKQFTIDKRVAKELCKPIYPSLKQIFKDVQNTTVSSKIAEDFQKRIEQLEDAKNRLNNVYEEQSSQVERVWQSEKLKLVPGDFLLDRVCQVYGVRFIKEQDSAHLATLMRENEIDIEIKRIICEIGNAS